ncbi:MAG TPA: aminopeptidase P family protein [Lachnospiraceae bacterium]|nr:aminopeptidase P family protein [Lachnospiraceae bacterium]
MSIFATRRAQLIKELMQEPIDAVLINNPSNLYYYTGFTGGEAMFLMPVNGDIMSTYAFELCGISNDSRVITNDWPDGYVITDSRYYEQVEKECEGLQLVKWESKGMAATIQELLVEDKKIQIILEDDMNLAQYMKLTEVCRNCAFALGSKWIQKPRMVKDAEELAKLEQAEYIGDAAFTHILDVLKPGVSEREIALELEFFMKKQGASKLSFDTIVASGANGSMPHAQVTDRVLQSGDFVTMDFGCVYEGYCSDMTRTVAIGTPTDEMKKVYQIVLDANLRAMEQIEAGKRCNGIDAVARDYIREQGYGEYFGHGLGHGVGLDIHEEPRFSPKCDVITQENMVITDEPGIYLPGQFGVRIEDLVVVKENGYQKLSQSEKKLIIL